MQMAALTMASSRSTATTGATTTRVTRRTPATWHVKVWPGHGGWGWGGRGRDDQVLLTALLFPPAVWKCPQRNGSRNQGFLYWAGLTSGHNAHQLGESSVSSSRVQKASAQPAAVEQQPTSIESMLCTKHFPCIADFIQLSMLWKPVFPLYRRADWSLSN